MAMNECYQKGLMVARNPGHTERTLTPGLHGVVPTTYYTRPVMLSPFLITTSYQGDPFPISERPIPTTTTAV